MERKPINEHDIEHASALDDSNASRSPPAKSGFGYYGSKQKVASKILKLLPPHNCWVELFCGSAAITLAKKAAPIEIINDIDGNVVNVFKQLRHQPEKLLRSIELTPYAREEFLLARHDKSEIDDLERARRFLVEAMMSINGITGVAKGGFSYSNTYSRSGKEARVNRWKNYPLRLQQVANRLKDTRIESVNATDLLSKFVNRPATLVYIDPPYIMDRQAGYAHDANDEAFHLELLKLCNRSKCMILISGYANDLYNDCLSTSRGWTRVEIATYTTATCGTKFQRKEIVWMNERAARAQKKTKIPIRLTIKERRENKVNPIRE